MRVSGDFLGMALKPDENNRVLGMAGCSSDNINNGGLLAASAEATQKMAKSEPQVTRHGDTKREKAAK